MKVIGTAGHVDHGKSALVQAMTGINPDRLREEQERQMTIDLGFAWMELPAGEEIGIIDVPGHRDFIDNMLAGVGGIDAALLVIAADEGVMPQTKEHLAIMELLEIGHGVIALSKVDLLEDGEWLDLVEDEVRDLLANSQFSDSPIVRVSAKTGVGLDELVNQLESVLKETSLRPDRARPRLPIDRVFTISGFGTVVTGTLIDGSFHVGEEVEVLPQELRGRIRGLQTHKTKVDEALPPSRTAMNLTGIERRSIARGDVVVRPGSYRSSSMIDVHYRHLNDADHSLEHDQEVKLFLGSAQCMARVRVLGQDEIDPGSEGWIQLMLERKLVAVRGDHYILRRPSPGATLGGGRVVDAHPTRRYKRKDQNQIKRLEELSEGSDEDVLVQSLSTTGPEKLINAGQYAGIDERKLVKITEAAIENGRIVKISKGAITENTLISEVGTWEGYKNRIVAILSTFHTENMLQSGILREELKSKLKIDSNIFSILIDEAVQEGTIKEIGTRIAREDYVPKLSTEQNRTVEELLDLFEKDPYSTPSVKECIKFVGPELFDYLIQSGTLIQLSPDVVYDVDTYEKIVDDLKERLEDGGTITVAEVRDSYGTSRKYALALMEYLDAEGITIREGDKRRLAN